MKNSTASIILTAALLAFLAASGCASVKGMAITALAPTFNDMNTAVNRLQDYEIVRQGIPSNIMLIEGLLEGSPDNRALLTLAAQTYCMYALGFVEDEDPDRASYLYSRGRDHGLKVLMQDPEFREGLAAGGEELDEALESFGRSDVAALFWTGNCWGSWINLNKHDIKALFDIPKVEQIMQRVLVLDETYFFGGPHLFFGLMSVSKPRMAGGNPDKAQEHFERIFAISDGKFLLPYVFYAQYYATFVFDEELYRSTLQRILDAPSDILSDQMLANEIAKRKARILIDRVEDYF